jgi:hypothetical protein
MNNGLEGVIAAETVLSHADGERGAVTPLNGLRPSRATKAPWR